LSLYLASNGPFSQSGFTSNSDSLHPINCMKAFFNASMSRGVFVNFHEVTC
jgi:hypothetical protein